MVVVMSVGDVVDKKKMEMEREQDEEEEERRLNAAVM